MTTKAIIRTYTELMRLPTFEERFEYLKLSALIGERTFGSERYLNQLFYRSPEWRKFRQNVIRRDNGCDLAMEDREIADRIEIHHINPITIEDVEEGSDILFDMDNVICTSPATHKAIHYGDGSLLPKEPIVRSPNDTCPWKM